MESLIRFQKLLQGTNQILAGDFQLSAMDKGKLSEDGLATRRNNQQHAPAVRPVPLFLDKAATGEPIRQLDCAVMTNVKPLRNLMNGRSNSLRKPPQGQ
jgi:hypothetical protein